MARYGTDILMYHSISSDPGPTSISPDVFSNQMQAIVAANVPVITMDEVAFRLRDGTDYPYAIAITFDDGFEDFESAAWPVLKSFGFSPMVYLPTDLVGKTENWADCNSPPRQLMGWDSITKLAKDGVHFGSHTATHPDMTQLAASDLEREISKPKKIIERKLARPVNHFAPPYGYSNNMVRDRISKSYITSVGTVLGTADSDRNLFDLPRLEMHYFADANRWENHLSGYGSSYLTFRKALRKLRQISGRA